MQEAPKFERPPQEEEESQKENIPEAEPRLKVLEEKEEELRELKESDEYKNAQKRHAAGFPFEELYQGEQDVLRKREALVKEIKGLRDSLGLLLEEQE